MQIVAALRERHELLDRLSRIQRSISHGAPLDEILDAITLGARDLLGDEIVGLRLVDPRDSTQMYMASGQGMTDEVRTAIMRASVGSGAGGRAIAEGRLVVIESYPEAEEAIPEIVAIGVHAAMAAPVTDGGTVSGSLVVASLECDRHYSDVEREVLIAFAEHASLALTDARVMQERERLAERHIEERFRSLVRHSTDLILVVDPNGAIAFQTPSVGRLLGEVPARLDLEGTAGLVHPDDADALRSFLAWSRETPGTIGPIVARCHGAGGDWREVEILATNLIDDIHVGGIVLNARDVTERSRNERALRESEERYRSIVETTNQGVMMLDAGGCLTFVNESLARIVGYRPSDLLGRPPWEFMAPEHRHQGVAALERRRRGVSESYETSMRDSDGEEVHVLVTATPILDPDGTFAGSVALISDLRTIDRARSEKAALEERLHRAQTLESIGNLTRQIAHDFKNLLGVVLGYATLMRDELREGGRAAIEDVEAILKAAEHGDVLTRQLLAYSRRDAVGAEALDLNEVVRDSLQMLRATTPGDVSVDAHVGPETLLVKTEAPALTQVVMNLVGNAFDAMPEGGDVVVTTRSTDVAPPTARGRPDLEPGRYAVLTVADSGCGMAPEVAARALEPMFTTKPLGEGTGLGLSIVHGVVQQTGGTVELHSSPGRGTTVEVLLPLTTEMPVAAVGPQEPAVPAPARQPGQGTILLVEDDDAVRDLTQRVLEAHGYTVVATANAEAALEVDRDGEEIFDLVLTDNAMADMSGVELVRRMATASRGLPAIVMSGYVAEPTAEGTEAPIAWLQKPFDASALLDAVRDALG